MGRPLRDSIIFPGNKKVNRKMHRSSDKYVARQNFLLVCFPKPNASTPIAWIKD